MKRTSFFSLLTILFLLFSLSPASLAGASDPQASVYAVPNDGNWSGTTDHGRAVSFTTSSSGTQWSNFQLSYSFTATSCGNPSVDFTTGVNGPGTISGGYFSWSGSTDVYTGTFTSPTTATGTYAFNNKQFIVYPSGIPCYFYLTASGTWSATVAVPPPGAFSKLTPVNAAVDQPTIVTLGWEASTNAASYEFCYGTSNPCSNWADNGLALTKTLTGLAPETTYYWQVRAKNGTGTTPANGGTVWSFTLAESSFVFLPLVFRPSQLPVSFVKLTPATGVTGQSTSPILTWGVSQYATNYEYCLDTSNNNTCNASWVSTGANTTASLTGLGTSTKYYWQVRASNTLGSLEADGGTWWSFTTTSTQPPAAFNKTSPANTATDVTTAPTLSWGTSNRATSYEYCIDTSNDNVCNTAWISTANLTSIGLAGLANSTTHYWQVRAVNLAGNTEANGGTWWAFTTAAPVSGWTTIISEDFEGNFPGVWNVSSQSSNAGYIWGKRNCQPFAGSYSAWAVGGGADGSSLGCGSNYPNKVDTIMAFGPFSLADATDVDVKFELWLQTASNDYVCRLASIDNINWYGTCTSGNTYGWLGSIFDLTDVYTLGNLLGQPNVWFALEFYSDFSTSLPAGSYVDNIVLRKCTSGSCPASASLPDFGNSRIIETPSHKTIP